MSSFSPVSADDWWKAIRKELKGKPEEELFTTWFDGLTTPPFHSWEDARPSSPLFPSYAWHASAMAEPPQLQRAAMAALNRGADGLRLKVEDHQALHKDLAAVQLAYLRTEVCPENLEGKWLDEWAATLQEQALQGSESNTALGLDLLDQMAFKSAFHLNLKSHCQSIGAIHQRKLFRHSQLVNTCRFQNAGARIDTQLGIALAAAHEYLVQGEWSDASLLHFRFAVGRDYLPEIAKLRAFRELWPLFLEELKLPNTAPVFITAENSFRPLSATDPHTNLLRLTTMAMSAVLGGAQNVLLHHHAIGQPLPKEEHLPLNILHLIRFEGRLDQVEDPLAGSYSVEALTQQIAEKGWEAFQKIEKQGGLLRSLEEGSLQQQIAEEAEAEQARFNAGHAPIIGSSIYPYHLPNYSEKEKTSASPEAFPLRRLAELAEQTH